MRRGRMQDELEWAERHPQEPEAKRFMDLARMYTTHQDAPTLGLLEGCAESIRKRMREEPDL